MEIHILIVLGVLGLFFLGWAIVYYRAPIGYEDEDGFHYGEPPEK